MSDVQQWEKRNELLAGIVIATTVLVVGYASGLGHLVGPLTPSVPFAVGAPGGPRDGQNGGHTAGSATTRVAVGAGTAEPVGEAAGTAPGNGRPAGTPGTSASSAPVGDAAPTGCSPALLSAIAQPFWTHLQQGHLDESPGQQVADILNTDRYVRTHTVLVEDMLTPLYEATSHVTDAASTFWTHVKHGHLEESPGQQIGDILDTDRYVKTHTVLVEDMLTPTATTATGTC